MKKPSFFLICGIALCSGSFLFGSAGPMDIDWTPKFTLEE